MNNWIDRPTEPGSYWMYPFCDGQHITPRILRITAFPGGVLKADDGGHYVELGLFLKEYYPESKWLFIPQPDCPK